MKLSWEHIFNTNHHKGWGTIDRAQKAALEAGYPFFIWNGAILRTADLKADFKPAEEIETPEKFSAEKEAVDFLNKIIDFPELSQNDVISKIISGLLDIRTAKLSKLFMEHEKTKAAQEELIKIINKEI